jgi:hypothetical protein
LGTTNLTHDFPKLFTCASNRNATIDRCLVSLGEGMAPVWDVTFNRNFNDWEVEVVAFHFLSSRVPNGDGFDGWRWRRNSNGIFYTRSFYVALRGEMHAGPLTWRSV